MSVDYVTKSELQDEFRKFGEELDKKLDEKLEKFPTKEEMGVAIAGAIEPLVTKTVFDEAVAKLATKAELDEAVAKLATKAELDEAVAKLATKAELDEAVARLATKEDFQALRHHFDVAVEVFRSEIRILADAVMALHKRQRKMMKYMKARLDQQDTRIDRLDAKVYLIAQRIGMKFGDEVGLPPSTP